ncbi:hypothetical protein GH714_036056 [Hevea brasiliensis]|uniref:Uncharacterized protein n=1 Tax=Hevea brasiliensis TaxID=3981 RepID=A0A6A6KKE7_HEVBR|nr:hypothetical protein GH714_036025 [Hevea brasiliensis]KAF2289420.1 hypothetical protein GH714_036056 [Hevea brasiliensis]
MGEAPAFVVDDLQNGYQNGFGLKYKDYETAITIHDKTYVIGGSDDESSSSIGVRIYDKATGNWEIPTVLGTKPKPCKSHSAVSLSDDRILIIKKGSSPDDCIWFLEVRISELELLEI